MLCIVVNNSDNDAMLCAYSHQKANVTRANRHAVVKNYIATSVDSVLGDEFAEMRRKRSHCFAAIQINRRRSLEKRYLNITAL